MAGRIRTEAKKEIWKKRKRNGEGKEQKCTPARRPPPAVRSRNCGRGKGRGGALSEPLVNSRHHRAHASLSLGNGGGREAGKDRPSATLACVTYSLSAQEALLIFLGD